MPPDAIGIGPHEVYYTSSGEKTIEVMYPTDSVQSQNMQVTVHEAPTNNLFLSINSTENAYNLHLDSICAGNDVMIHISGGVDSLFRWIIPQLYIDTISNNTIEVKWDLPEGEYIISTTEISSYSCVGEPVETTITIDECKENEIFNDEIYAFTPNSDGINDFWEIENIESYPLARIKVFDRNGKIVFTSEGYYQNDWDGTKDGKVLDLNSYFFIIDFSAYQKGIVRGVLTILHE